MTNGKKIILTLVLASAIIIPAYSFGFGFGNHHASNYTIPEGMELTGLEISDGTYEGSADGFRPGLVVEVTVEKGKVTTVEVVDHNEIGRRFWQKPIDLIPGAIVDSGETIVDSVSGATATSKAIMSAVEDALKKA